MQTVSELIGKPLLTRSGAYLGCVRNVQTDARCTRIRNLEYFDREEEELLLPASAVAEYGADALVVKSAARQACKNCVPLPLKTRAFSHRGDELGAIDDFTREGLLLTGVTLSDGRTYPLARLRKVTDAAVLDLSDPAEHAGGNTDKEARAEKERENAALSREAAAPSSTETPDGEALAGAANGNVSAAGAPPRKQAGQALLTGKILPEPLLDARGNVLAPAGTRVTAEVIRRAMAHNKLFALTTIISRNFFQKR